ncbi:MAG: MBL fold metallo-hydrolase [Candidatus Thermoplasmatota archaeon]|nr:MBL fold metallo-hydrolase [Candidatus Thermoplasmatota archaeon]
MKLTIVYDNEVSTRGMGLKADWGFSCLIQTAEHTLLFDTGAQGSILLHNMEILRIDPHTIRTVVLSHEHGDHTGGLQALAPEVQDATVYRLAHQLPKENMRCIVPEESQKITEGVYTTGRLSHGPVDEQALILEGTKGLYVLAGCSHCGVEDMFRVAQQYGPVNGLIGGLHGFTHFSILDGLEYICPCHCTQHTREIQKRYPQAYTPGGVGKVAEI